MKNDTILCELYADTYSDVYDECKTEILDSDSQAPATSSHNQS
jgi:hypothetical protein